MLAGGFIVWKEVDCPENSLERGEEIQARYLPRGKCFLFFMLLFLRLNF